MCVICFKTFQELDTIDMLFRDKTHKKFFMKGKSFLFCRYFEQKEQKVFRRKHALFFRTILFLISFTSLSFKSNGYQTIHTKNLHLY